MTTTGSLVFCLVFCFISLPGAFGVTPPATRIPFICFVDVCNSNNDWQYCDVVTEQRCRYCSAVQRDCFSSKMPTNCTTFCKDQFIEQEKVKGCGPLNQTAHGHHNISNSEHRYGDVIGLQCDSGYHCDGPCSISCREFGYYSGSLKCAENQCSGFVKHRNWKYDPEKPKYFVGEKTNFSCSKGFIIKGDASATCLADGLWSIKENPTCIKEENKDGEYLVAVSICAVCLGVFFIGVFIGYLIWKRKTCCNQSTDPEYQMVSKSDLHSDKQFDSKETQTSLPSSQSVADLMPKGHMKGNGALYGRQSSSSENNISSASNYPSGSPTPADSKDSGLGRGNTKENPVCPTINININNNPSNNNQNLNDNTCKGADDKPENSKETNKSDLTTESKLPNNDKYSTEESGEKADECHGELQDDHVLPSTNHDNETTSRKQINEHEDQGYTNINTHRLFITTSEKYKGQDPLNAQSHGQAMDANDKPVKLAIRETSFNQDDIPSGHVKKGRKESQVCIQATEGNCKTRKMALNQNEDNQDDTLSKDQKKEEFRFHTQAREDNEKPGQHAVNGTLIDHNDITSADS